MRRSLTMGRIFLLLLILLLSAASAVAMELDEMLARAVQTDARLQGLSGVLTNALLNIDKARLAPGFQMQLSTGQVRLGYSINPSAGEPPWVVYAEPSGALVLGRKTETEVNVQVPFIMEFGGGETPVAAALPKVSIRQPVDKLFGGEKLTTVQKRETLLAAEEARIDVLKRVSAVEQTVVSQLAALSGLEKTGKQLERDFSDAQDALGQARELKTYAEGSAQQRQLELSAVRLQRELELNELKREVAWRKLERLVGEKVDALPANLPKPVIELPGADMEKRNPVVHLARLGVDLEEARLEEERGPSKPKFYLAGVVNNTVNEFRDERETAVSGGVEGEFDDLLLSAGVGGIVETGTVFVSAGLSWTLRDRKIESLNLQERENAVEVSRWNLAAARAEYQSNYELLSLELEEIELRRRGLEDDRALADLRLADAKQWLDQGLISQAELDEARWERDRLDFSERILQLDALLLSSRLEAFTPQDGDKQ